jgi:hypothetical protein
MLWSGKKDDEGIKAGKKVKFRLNIHYIT